MNTTVQQLGLREVIQLKPVRRLCMAQAISVFGDFLAIFAVLSYASFHLHASPAQVTGISIAFLIPFALVGPVAGVFVDRWNVKRTMIASDLIRAVLALALIFAVSLDHIYAILFILSTVSAFFMPAQSVTVRTVVPAEGLMSANALLQQAFQVMRIISPALAGILVAWFGPGSCYTIDSLSFLFSAALIATVTIAREPVAPAKDSHPFLSVMRDLSAGIRFIFTHATISFVVLAMAAAMFAVSCFGPLIAVYVRDELKASSVTFGIINSLIGFGMIAGSLLLGKMSRGRSKAHLALTGLLGMGGFVLLLAALRHLAAVSISMFGIGVSVMLVIVPAQTLMQGKTPVNLIGRVSGSIWAVLSIAQLIGLVFSGAYTQVLGIRNTFYASAALILLITVFGYFRIPSHLAGREADPLAGDAAATESR